MERLDLRRTKPSLPAWLPDLRARGCVVLL
jgi:hypothetical protein